MLCWAAPIAASAAEVAVDVGHSLDKPGVISVTGVPEFEYNKALAFRVREALESTGLRVRMIGERGDFTELAARPRAATGADLFVQIIDGGVRQFRQ